MFNLTRKTDYSLVALAVLGQKWALDQQPVSARQIADEFDLPLPLLMNLLKHLVHAGIVSSVRGSQGGYLLAIDPAQLSLMDVVVAIEGPIRLTPCCTDDHVLGDKQDCRLTEACPIRQPIRRLHAKIAGFLEQVTLAELFESETNDSLGCTCDTVSLDVNTSLTGCACKVEGVLQDGH